MILGCTEIGLLVSAADFDIPTFDSTLLHADAAVRISLAPAMPALGERGFASPLH